VASGSGEILGRGRRKKSFWLAPYLPIWSSLLFCFFLFLYFIWTLDFIVVILSWVLFLKVFLLQLRHFWSQLRSRAMVYRLFSKSPPFGTSTKLFNLFNAGMRSIICIILDCNYNIGFM
jgi:hypothetical protein